ncbi:MAG: CcmD family protein [Desulfovibrionaceae bacterium]
MGAEGYLLAANVAVWIGLGAYAAYLWIASARLSRRLDQFEALCREEETGS